MRKVFAVLTAAVLGVSALSTARADDVYTTAGDHLIGTVTTIDGGKLTLHSEALGDEIIPMTAVKTFSTDKPVEVVTSDGTKINAQASQSDAGAVVFGSGQKVALTDIDVVNPVPFTGSVFLGGTLIRGNSFTDTLAAGINLGYKVGKDQVTFKGQYTYGDTKNVVTNVKTTTTDRWEVYGKFQHFYTPKFYAYIDADLTKDRIAFLDLRFAPSAGVGYQWFDKAPFMFGTEAGVAWFYQKYTNGTPTHEPLAFKFAYHLTYDFNDSVSLFHDLTYIPTVPRVSTYFITADLGLHTKLSKKLFTEVKLEWDYNSQPANGALKNDTRFLVNLGYTL